MLYLLRFCCCCYEDSYFSAFMYCFILRLTCFYSSFCWCDLWYILGMLNHLWLHGINTIRLWCIIFLCNVEFVFLIFCEFLHLCSFKMSVHVVCVCVCCAFVGLWYLSKIGIIKREIGKFKSFLIFWNSLLSIRINSSKSFIGSVSKAIGSWTFLWWQIFIYFSVSLLVWAICFNFLHLPI